MRIGQGAVRALASVTVGIAVAAGCTGQLAQQDLGVWTPGAVPNGSSGSSAPSESGATGSGGTPGAGGIASSGDPGSATSSAPQGDSGLVDEAAASSSSASDVGGGSSSSAGAMKPPYVWDGGAGTLPCDVANLLAAKCTACHADPPVNGSLSGLVTFADMTMAAKEDPTKSEAQLSVARMQSQTLPMPPASVKTPANASDVALLQNWINAGYPSGACSQDAGGGDAAIAVGSNVFAGQPAYALGTEVSGHHNSGQNCLSHHHDGEFSIAGTVFDANGKALAGAEVRVIDGSGATHVMYSGTNGNFYTRGSTTMALGGHTGARNGGATALMVSKPSGACNSCHTSGGAAAPIHLP